MPPALRYPRRAHVGHLRRGETLRPIPGHSAALAVALRRPGGLFAIRAACSRALRQSSALKREGRSRAEPEPGELSPASGCLLHPAGTPVQVGGRNGSRCHVPGPRGHDALQPPGLGVPVPGCWGHGAPSRSWRGPFSPRSPPAAPCRGFSLSCSSWLWAASPR